MAASSFSFGPVLSLNIVLVESQKEGSGCGVLRLGEGWLDGRGLPWPASSCGLVNGKENWLDLKIQFITEDIEFQQKR